MNNQDMHSLKIICSILTSFFLIYLFETIKYESINKEIINFHVKHNMYYHFVYMVILHTFTILSKNTKMFVVTYALIYLFDGFNYFDTYKKYIFETLKPLNTLQLCIAFTLYNFIIQQVFTHKYTFAILFIMFIFFHLNNV